MLNVLTIRPPLEELYNFIDRVPQYPVTPRQLVQLASKLKAPQEVREFYKSFDQGLSYDNRDELTTVSEQVDFLRQEEPEMPAEIELSPEEY
jgi:hypothetical protein